jgi:hypothetical protein
VNSLFLILVICVTRLCARVFAFNRRVSEQLSNFSNEKTHEWTQRSMDTQMTIARVQAAHHLVRSLGVEVTNLGSQGVQE